MSGAGRHSVRHDHHPKDEPRSVDLHALARQAHVFVVPASTLPPSSAHHYRGDTSLVLGLDLVCETADGERQFGLLLGPTVDPFELAGELEGAAQTIVRSIAIELGLDAQEAATQAREIARKDRLAARRETVEQAPRNLTCDRCPRSVFVIVDGVRLCKRHAEEAGVRPHGKIGDEL